MINDGFGRLSSIAGSANCACRSPTRSPPATNLAFGVPCGSEVQRAISLAGGVVEYRGISQGQLFWHHKFGPGKTDAWVWAGLPSDYRLNGQQ